MLAGFCGERLRVVRALDARGVPALQNAQLYLLVLCSGELRPLAAAVFRQVVFAEKVTLVRRDLGWVLRQLQPSRG